MLEKLRAKVVRTTGERKRAIEIARKSHAEEITEDDLIADEHLCD